PAYLDPNLQPSELATGVNFASGGAGYDPLTSKLGVAISMSGQLDLFKDYIVKLKGVVGEDRAKFIIGNSLFLVVLGSNDISNTYYLSRLRQVQYDFPTYSDLLVNSAYNFYQRTMAGGIERKCVQEYNDAAVFFNNKLSIGIDSFKQNFPSCRIAYMDVYNPLLDIIAIKWETEGVVAQAK
ncbi:GDSL esterase/lipase, partial [Trifolium medium]|nr:GDSL esterase/lipase [Trifolium medium]